MTHFLHVAVAVLAMAQGIAPQGGGDARPVQVSVLMTAEDFAARNAVSLREELQYLDPTSAISTIESNDPLKIDYVDPKHRFELKLPSVGSPANTTRFMVSHGTRLGLQVPAIKYMEFALSDGEPMRQRLQEALSLQEYLESRGFRSAGYAGFQIGSPQGELSTLPELISHADHLEFPERGGIELFVLQRDELFFAVSILPQHITPRADDYTLYTVIREKTEGVED